MYKIFIVDEETWPEHKQAQIAAINDPHTTHPSTISMKQRQGAISEMTGLRPGDNIIFYIRGTQELFGIYEATTNSYFNPSPLFPGAIHVTGNLPFRIGFKKIINFDTPLVMEDIWKAKEKGFIWSIQQSRGDRVNVRGNWSISKPEYQKILKMLKEVNLTYSNINSNPPRIINRANLPINDGLKRSPSSKCNADVLNYEDALVSILVEQLRNNQFQNIFGHFDDILVKAPTGSRRELDILLLKYENNNIIWFQIIEVKREQFDLENAKQLYSYYDWYIQEIPEGNYRNIHPIALAYCFTDDVFDYIRNLKLYDMKYPRLIQYRYLHNTLTLTDVTP